MVACGRDGAAAGAATMSVVRRPLPALLLTIAMTWCSAPRGAGAQAVPGNAPGSQTGDGAGAYTGIASSPEANLFTGVAQTSIPIEVPPGRLGLAPVLALSYSSTAAASAYGYGWSLPLPRIHRSTRRGLPRYDDSDTFVLEMPGAIVELERIPGSPRGFRAEIESAYLRIGFHDSDNLWKVIDKLGVTFVFGASAATRTGRGAARSETFAWLLERIEDAAGNRIEFSYLMGRPGGGGGTSSGLPDAIRYGANSHTGAAHFAEVTFTWAALTRGGPPRVSWRDGYADSLDVKLAVIETSTHGLRARRYDFSFEEDAVTADLRLVGATLTAFAANPADDVTLPSTVFVYAPTMTSGWPAVGSTTALQGSFEVPSAGILHHGGNNVAYDSVDLDGDAVIDRIDSGLRMAMLGNGRGFGPLRPWNWPTTSGAPRTVRRIDGNGNLVSNTFDLDGDGFADLVDSSPAGCAGAAGVWCIWRGSADGFASAPTKWSSPVTSLRVSERGGGKVLSDLIDMNADGRPDLVDASGYDEAAGIRSWNVYRNTGSGFDPVATRFRAPVPWLSRSQGARLVYGLFDINSDSLPDLISADPEEGGGTPKWAGFAAWHVYLNHGDGLAAEASAWPIDGGVGSGTGLPNFLNLHATDGSVIADLFDITGDGRPDLVRRWRPNDPPIPGAVNACVHNSRCGLPSQDDSAISASFCCYNILVYANTGSSFAQPVAWSSPAHGLRASNASCAQGDVLSCGYNTIYDFDFFDFDGDGLVEFVERYTAAGRPGSWLVHPHPSGVGGTSARPNLMLAMRNGVGGETMLRYRAAAATPETRFPFPHWIVRERELADSVYDGNALRTSFSYRAGLFDPVDREMRGFAMVQEVDPVGTIRVREYHQDRRRAGRLRRVTSLAPPACVPADPENPSDPCSPWHSPLGATEYDWPGAGAVLLRSETDAPFHNGEAVENLRRTTSYEYDAFGNVARRVVESPMAATTTTTTTWVTRVADKPGGMPERYLVAKPTHAMTEEAGRLAPLVERTFEYEWQTATPGVLSATSTCMSWSGRACSRWSRRSFGYDPYGNMIVAHGPDGATSTTDYDGNRLFATRSIDPVGLVTRATTDPRSGRVSQTVAPNGNSLQSRHDGLGRLLRTWGPGTSEASPLRRLRYAPGELGASPPRVVAFDAASGTTAAFFDGLGRSVATRTTSRNAARDVTVVSGLRRYDERGLVVAEVLPFDSDHLEVGTLAERFEDAPAWIEYRHDEAGRLQETRAPDGSSTRVDTSAPGIVRSDDANVGNPASPGSVTLEVFDGLARRILRETCSAPPTAAAPYECASGKLMRRESWTYDGLGRTEETRTAALGVAAGDAVTRIGRDGLGNPVSVFHSNTGTWNFRHDDNGRVIGVDKPDGSRVSTSYDASGRLLRRRSRTSTATYRYHRNGGGIGKLRRVITRSRRARVSEDLRYDDRGRVSDRHRRIAPRRAAPAELTTLYHYDEFDRRIATEYPDWEGDGENVLHTDYDSFGRQARVWSAAHGYVISSSRDSLGRLLRSDYGNGLSNMIAFEARDNDARTAGHLHCMRTTLTPIAESGACAVAAADLDDIRYTAYDKTGRLLEAEDPLHDAADPRHDPLRYRYDALGRITEAGSPSSRRERFDFDPLGNLTRNGDFVLEYDDPDHPGRVTSTHGGRIDVWTSDHDGNGRRIRDGDRTLTYDDDDRLTAVAIDGETVAEYGYIDSGERVFRYDSARGTYEFDLGDGVRIDGDQLERTIFFGGRPVCVERRAVVPRAMRAVSETTRGLLTPTPVRVFLHHDHQQSIRMVTDDLGRAVEYNRYRAFGARRVRLDGSGRPFDQAATRFAYTGHVEDEEAGLLFFGARYYDPRTGSFVTLDPRMQFASPYAYSDGNPVAGRDADGSVFELTAIELVTILVGTATFVDSIVSTGDLGHSLTAGVFAGFSVYLSGQLTTAIARPLAQSGNTWLQMGVSVASHGLQGIQAVEAIEDGRYAGGIVAAGLLAASLIGIESAADPGVGTTTQENYERHGIKDRGMIDGKRVIDVNGICSTRPGCVTNTLIAARENLKVLFGAPAGCVGGCEHVAGITTGALKQNQDVLLRCNSFGAIKCLGAIGSGAFSRNLASNGADGVPKLSVEMSGAPLLRPPAIRGVTYQANLFDPVVWVGTAWSAPFRSDVVLGRNWWVPVPVVVHHSRMYEKPFSEALGEILP